MEKWNLFIKYYYCHYLGKQEAAEATLEALKAVPEPLGKWASVLVEICAYAGMFFSHSRSLSLILLHQQRACRLIAYENEIQILKLNLLKLHF